MSKLIDIIIQRGSEGERKRREKLVVSSLFAFPDPDLVDREPTVDPLKLQVMSIFE